jgi:iron complex outermembrane recepter protein
MDQGQAMQRRGIKVLNIRWKSAIRRVCVLAMSVTSVYAAEPAQTTPGPDKSADALSEIVITGSRISARGFTQPTPTTILSEADIAKAAEPNLFNTISQLPSLQGSTGRTVNVNSTSSGLQGLSSFSLRGLGANRTLTLLDGQRFMPANVTAVTDISEFPQLLVNRVDVVTGGASASYGSDAVGGVVNFITDKKFVGFKTNLEGGITTYGDDANVTAQAAWGHAFADNRLHVEVSGEYGREGGVPAFGFGIGPGPNGRNWFQSPAFQVRPIGQAIDGKPQMTVIEQAQWFQIAKYGLITSGPLQGTAFGANGAPFQFQYGSNGAPTHTGGVTNCFSPFCVGGDLSGTVGNGTSLASKLQRAVGYTRISYDLNADNEVFFTANLAEVRSVNTPNPGAAKNANLTIQCSNPFVPASIQAACTANNITSFQFGTSNAEFPNFINVHPTRTQERYVAGADGKFTAWGKDWSYNGYYQHGNNQTDLFVNDISLTPRYNAAIDAVAGPNGTIVCRSAAAQASGCQPLNVIGNVTPSAAAIAYVLPPVGPHQYTAQSQDVASINVSGEPFSLWAGPLAVAAGAEYRKESYSVRGDPYGAGVSTDTPNTANYPADPLLNTAVGNNWYAGNYHNAQGSYNVKEGYLELNLPFLNSEKFGDANLNVAGRETDYSTSGRVSTWKIGGTWKTPIDGVRIRAVTSHDVRAPNLSELFAAQITTNNTVNNNGSVVTILQETVGNTNLRPESARNREFGIVLSQPSWLPGFSASFDYYDIKVDGVISTLSAQQIVDLCNAGNQELCSQTLLNSPIANTNFVRVQAFNLASLANKGFDIELGYRANNGLSIRALATHTISFLTTSGVIGTIPTQGAGVNLGSTPNWKALAIESWDTEKFSLSVTERWFSDGVYSNEWIECQTNCPNATVTHPTINDNRMKGETYVDVGGSYNIGNDSSIYFKVDNALNQDPAPAPQTNVGYGANPFLYDVLGRMYRIGVRYKFY